MIRYDLEPVEPPALPIAPPEYNQAERDRYSNVLRLYFNRLAAFVRGLVGTAGGRFLDVPNGSFADTRDYLVDSSAVDAPLRFDTIYNSNGVQIITEVISQNEFGGNLFATVTGNVLDIVVFLGAVDIYVGMEVTMVGLPAGTYITQKNSATQYLISNTATLSSSLVSFTGQSKVQVTYPGWYNFQFSIQFVNTTNDVQTISIWWRKNGVDIPDSNSNFGIKPRKSSGSSSELIASMNFFVEMEREDYIQIVWRISDPDVYIEHFAAVPAGVGTPAIPATPSVILTSNFISRLANT